LGSGVFPAAAGKLTQWRISPAANAQDGKEWKEFHPANAGRKFL
jgi:hypothetical protein